MNNAYDHIYKGIPVTFFDGNPGNGNVSVLDNSFKTPGSTKGCDTFSAVINTPSTGTITAAVNYLGGNAPAPGIAFNETDFTNNLADTIVVPFVVQLVPSDTTIQRNGSVPFKATVSGGQQGSITWSPSTYLSCINCNDPIANPPFSQQYIVSARNDHACIVSDTAMIRTYTDGRVNIPNAFTPNGDGKNDVFYILGSQDILLVSEFAVYNRYGEKVFGVTGAPANNPVYGWDGKVHGKTGASDTYVYSATILFRDGSKQQFKGTITLIH